MDEKNSTGHQWEYTSSIHQRQCVVCTLWEGDYSRSISCEGKPHVCSVESGCFPAERPQ